VTGTHAAEWLFYAFAALAVFSGLATITRRNPVVAAVWLVLCFVAVAGCYVLLSATFLAAIQVLVYAGALVVLFVFVIMVLDVDDSGAAKHRGPSTTATLGYAAAVTAGAGVLVWVFGGTLARQVAIPPKPLPAGAGFGSAESVGRLLFGHNLFAFEAVSLLLLAAVIGAVVVARSRREHVGEGP